MFVLETNRQEYVDRYVDFVLNTSVEKQYSFFSKGFLHVCGGRVFNLFHPQELMDMVIGDEHYDWDEFEQVGLRPGANFIELLSTKNLLSMKLLP